MRHFRRDPQAEPWWTEMFTGGTDIRYKRALRLTQMLRELRRGVTPLMHAGRIVRRQRCIEHWQHYLEHGEPPDA